MTVVPVDNTRAVTDKVVRFLSAFTSLKHVFNHTFYCKRVPREATQLVAAGFCFCNIQCRHQDGYPVTGEARGRIRFKFEPIIIDPRVTYTGLMQSQRNGISN